MEIIRESLISYTTNSYDLPVTVEQMNEWLSPTRQLIQNIFPDLTAWQRDFIKYGYTLEEQNLLFSMDLSAEQIQTLNKQFNFKHHE